MFPEGVEIVEGDLGDAGSLPLDGVRSLFLLSGVGEDADILAAAARAGVEHVVLVSSITVETHPHPSGGHRGGRVCRVDQPGHRKQAYALTGPARVSARQQAADIGAVLGKDVFVDEISRAEAHRDMASYMGDETASAVLDLMGGDVNDALLDVRDTVPRVTGAPARPFRRWATENAAAFR